uniref:U5 small nuclear ribonucleoprotein TSSC4-like n=1 Tax=Semicossyphus pulcher TaxID=241346 RepID=UPI0037E96F8E
MCDQKNGSDLGDDVDELSASDDSEPEERPNTAPFDPELDHSDEDDEEEVCAPAGLRAQGPFSLRGGGSAFSHRSQSIFDCLDSVARLASSSSSSSSSSTSSSSTSSSSSSVNQQSGSDGVFARPLPPPPNRKTSQPPPSSPTPAKRRGAPDYLLHPERWTHYSLEEVSETSEQGNSRAALSFLSDLKERREEGQRREEEQRKEQQQESQSDSSSCHLQHKMIFSRPSRLTRDQPAEQPSAVRSKEKETHLSHLQEEEEKEEEEEEGKGKGREKHKAGGRRTEQIVEEAEEKQTVGTKEEKEKGEEEEVEEKVGEVNPSFTSFRKMKRKNYRRSSGREEN